MAHGFGDETWRIVSLDAPLLARPSPRNEQDAIPERGNASRKSGNAILEGGSAFDKSASALPKSASALPDSGNTWADSGRACPNFGSAFPDSGSAFPESTNAFPQGANAARADVRASYFGGLDTPAAPCASHPKSSTRTIESFSPSNVSMTMTRIWNCSFGVTVNVVCSQPLPPP